MMCFKIHWSTGLIQTSNVLPYPLSVFTFQRTGRAGFYSGVSTQEGRQIVSGLRCPGVRSLTEQLISIGLAAITPVFTDIVTYLAHREIGRPLWAFPVS